MSANTETTGADRTKCKAWCGAIPNSEAGQLYSDCDESVFNGGAFAPEGFEDMDPRDDANVRWCSAACRDARLPPIAAPAAHVERRKGHDMRPVTMLQPDQASNEMIKQLQKHIDDAYRLMAAPRWLVPAGAFADATPEPAKHNDAIDAIRYALSVPPELAKGEAATIVDCAVKPGWSHFPGVVCECKGTPAKSPPAQEAPKAAPVAVCIDCDTAPIDRPVPMRFFGRVGHARPICDECYQEREKYIGEGAGTPYAGPERLPKPQLAADWVEDCLGDVR